jgi:hypothetical protein
MADYSLALGVRPPQIEDPLTSYSKFASIQNAQTQNALVQQQLATARRAEAKDIERTNALASAGTDDTAIANALIRSGDLQGYSQFVKSRRETLKADTELVTETLKQSRLFLDAIDPDSPDAPQQFKAWTEANHRNPVLSPVFAARGITPEQSRGRIEQALRQGPQAFAQLLMQSKLGTEEFIKQNAPKFFTRDTGGETQVISVPGLGGSATTVQGSSATKTLTPGEAKPTVSQVDVGNEVLTQSYDPVTGKITVLERRSKGMTPGEAKPTVSQVDVGNEVLTQSYDPVTGKITVLERRSKGMTPGESKPTVSQVDVGDRVLTQSYNPVTGEITVLEDRPKGLTPGESRPQLSNVDLGGTVSTRLFNPATGELTQVSEDKKTLSPRAPHYISSPQGVMAIDPITQKPTPVLINGKPLLDSSTVNGQEQLKIARQRLNLSAQAERRLQEEADSSGGLSPQALDIAANMVIQSGVMPPLGSGKNASLARVQVMNRVAEMTGTDAAAGASNIISNQQNTLAAKAALKDFTSGVSARRVASNNTAINHLETMDSLATDLNNKDIRIFNAAGNAFATATGKPAPASFDAAKQLVAAEVIKAVVNNGGGVTERQEAAENFSRANSPQQLKSVINTYRVLLGGQLESLENQYKAGTKRDDFRTTFLTPNTRKVLPAEPAKPAARNSGGVDLSNPLLK